MVRERDSPTLPFLSKNSGNTTYIVTHTRDSSAHTLNTAAETEDRLQTQTVSVREFKCYRVIGVKSVQNK